MSRLIATFATRNEIVTNVPRGTLKPKSRKGTKKMVVRLGFTSKVAAKQAAQHLLGTQRWGSVLTPGPADKEKAILELREDYVTEIESMFGEYII